MRQIEATHITPDAVTQPADAAKETLASVQQAIIQIVGDRLALPEQPAGEEQPIQIGHTDRLNIAEHLNRTDGPQPDTQIIRITVPQGHAARVFIRPMNTTVTVDLRGKPEVIVHDQHAEDPAVFPAKQGWSRTTNGQYEARRTLKPGENKNVITDSTADITVITQ